MTHWVLRACLCDAVHACGCAGSCCKALWSWLESTLVALPSLFPCFLLQLVCCFLCSTVSCGRIALVYRLGASTALSPVWTGLAVNPPFTFFVLCTETIAFSITCLPSWQIYQSSSGEIFQSDGVFFLLVYLYIYTPRKQWWVISHQSTINRQKINCKSLDNWVIFIGRHWLVIDPAINESHFDFFYLCNQQTSVWALLVSLISQSNTC